MVFKRKHKEVPVAVIEPVDENSKVLDYLVNLSDDEYDKFIKVARVYRDADKKANGIMGKDTSGVSIPVRIEPPTVVSQLIETDEKKAKK